MKNKLDVLFYQSEFGREPVREWLKNLPRNDKKVIGEDIKTVQFGWPLGMPLVRNLGHELWEIRSRLNNKRIARIIFFMKNNKVILIHGFVKKTQKIPQKDICLALFRKKQIEKGQFYE